MLMIPMNDNSFELQVQMLARVDFQYSMLWYPVTKDMHLIIEAPRSLYFRFSPLAP